MTSHCAVVRSCCLNCRLNHKKQTSVKFKSKHKNWHWIKLVWKCYLQSSSHFVFPGHYSDVIINMVASQITGVSIVCSAVCSCADQRINQGSASLGFVREIHRWPVNSPHKWPASNAEKYFHLVTSSCDRKVSLWKDVIQWYQKIFGCHCSTWQGAFKKGLWALKSKSS